MSKLIKTNTLTPEYNVDIVGNLVNDNGVLSGFSHGNYAKTPNAISLGNNFELVIKTNFGTTTDSIAFFNQGDRYLALGYDTAGGGINFNVGNGPSWLNPTFTDKSYIANADIWLKVTYDGSTYKLYKSYDGIEYGNNIAYLNSAFILPSLRYQLGENRIYSQTGFPVNIDLNECYIKVNNKLVWQGVSYKNNCKLIKTNTLIPEYNVNIVGNLTNNNGVLSGFSSSNYDEIPSPPIAFGNNFEFKIKFTTGSDVNTIQVIAGTNLPYYGMELELYNGQFLFLAGDGSQWISNAYTGGTALPNTTYYVKMIRTGNTYKFDISTDDINYTTVVSYNSSTLPNNNFQTYRLGIFCQLSAEFLGTIDLNDCYLINNGVKVWKGVSYKNNYKVISSPAITKFIQPILSTNGTLGGNSFACQSSGDYSSSTFPAYYAFDSSDSTRWVAPSPMHFPEYLIAYNPSPILVKSVKVDSFSSELYYEIEILGSNDNIVYEQIGYWSGSAVTATITCNSNKKYKYIKTNFLNAQENVSVTNIKINGYVEV